MPGRPAVKQGIRSPAAACAAFCWALLAPPQALSGALQDREFGQLAGAPGAEETYYACTACHSEMIIAQQGKTREGWAELLDWMAEEQGMAELDPFERSIILDYLATHYNTDRPNFPNQ